MEPRDPRKIIGKDMAMIFQEPMSSLNPCFTAGYQIKEALKLHLGLDRAERHARAIELLEMVGIPDPEQRLGHHAANARVQGCGFSHDEP